MRNQSADWLWQSVFQNLACARCFDLLRNAPHSSILIHFGVALLAFGISLPSATLTKKNFCQSVKIPRNFRGIFFKGQRKPKPSKHSHIKSNLPKTGCHCETSPQTGCGNPFSKILLAQGVLTCCATLPTRVSSYTSGSRCLPLAFLCPLPL